MNRQVGFSARGLGIVGKDSEENGSGKRYAYVEGHCKVTLKVNGESYGKADVFASFDGSSESVRIYTLDNSQQHCKVLKPGDSFEFSFNLKKRNIMLNDKLRISIVAFSEKESSIKPFTFMKINDSDSVKTKYDGI